MDPKGEFVFITTTMIVWGTVELGFAVYDLYDAGATLIDPCASNLDKAISGGGFLLGVAAPGGGYGVLGKKGKKLLDGADDALDSLTSSQRKSIR